MNFVNYTISILSLIHIPPLTYLPTHQDNVDEVLLGDTTLLIVL